LPAPVRILVSCGEPSGDLYGAELVRHLRGLLPALQVFGLGGDRLAAEQASLVAHVRDLAVVGLLEVVRHLRKLRGIFKTLLDEVDRAKPDLAVLVDYPDFNLRLARELHARGVPVVYYVSPQLWAWRGGRMGAIRRAVARMLVIFPFEEELYRNAGVPVTFVGHPLLDLVKPAPDRVGFLAGLGLDPEQDLVALLPGSRPQEIAHNLPALAEATDLVSKARPRTQFVVAAAPSVRSDLYTPLLGGRRIPVIVGQTQGLVGAARLAWVASGTATVETAILGTPMLVVYRLSSLTYLLGRPFVRVDQFAMVNLIAGRPFVKELIQDGFTAESVASEALRLLGDEDAVRAMRNDLRAVKGRLGGPGASGRAAEAVRQELVRVRPDIDTAKGSV
jgi:lipid-A-disaccharide synthase